MEAGVDPTNQALAWKLIKTMDKVESRTVGVLTKADRTVAGNIMDYINLKISQWPLQHGYFAVMHHSYA